MLIGLPGSGKSTWLKTRSNGFVASTDDYIQKNADELGISYNEAFPKFIKEAAKNMNEQIVYWISLGEDVYLDQTNLSSVSRARKLQPFKDAGYRCEAYEFQSMLGIDEINELRPDKVIPDHIYIQMENNYDPPLLSEGFDYMYSVYWDINQ